MDRPHRGANSRLHEHGYSYSRRRGAARRVDTSHAIRRPEKLTEFQAYLNENDIGFELRQLYEISHPRTGGQFGLTPKQTEALTTAWDMGYFALPREATTEEVATELDIAPQTLSDRLWRVQHHLIQNTLYVETPTDIYF